MRTYPVDQENTLRNNPAHAEFRRDAPITRVRMPYGEDAWLVTRYQDVKAVLSDPRFSRAAWREHDEPRTFPEPQDFGLVSMDPPEHTQLRALVAGAFTERRVRTLRERIVGIANELLDQMIAAGPPADIVTDYSEPLAAHSICELVGVPVHDWDKFRDWMSAVFATREVTPEEREARLGEMSWYLVELTGTRRGQPTDDLVSTLTSALPDEQAVGVVMMLLGAGYDSTAANMTNLIHVLLRRPEHTEQLMNAPDLAPQAVEELLRFVPTSTTPFFPRYATEDVQIGDVTIRTGEAVVCLGASANMDDAAFTDPHLLDFSAQRASQLVFGYGIHRCVGAQLARAEFQVGITALLGRLPGITITQADDELPWRHGQFGRGVTALPVSW